jgi:hypothetical protein
MKHSFWAEVTQGFGGLRSDLPVLVSHRRPECRQEEIGRILVELTRVPPEVAQSETGYSLASSLRVWIPESIEVNVKLRLHASGYNCREINSTWHKVVNRWSFVLHARHPRLGDGLSWPCRFTRRRPSTERILDEKRNDLLLRRCDGLDVDVVAVFLFEAVLARYAAFTDHRP